MKTLQFLVKRLVIFLPLMLLVLAMSYALMQLAPGNPFLRENSKIDSEEVRQALNRKLFLDQPKYVQFGMYLKGLFWTFDLPSSQQQGRTVWEIIGKSLPVSVSLGMLAMIVALLVGLPAGVFTGLRQHSALDWGVTAVVLLGISVPNFVVAVLLIVLLAFNLMILPPAGWGGLDQLILPSVVLALPYIAYIARLSRVGLIETMRQDYVRTARAKGLDERAVIMRHAFGNSVLPVVSFLGPAVAGILTGSLVVEKVFSIPGMGNVFVDAATNRDYFVAFGAIFVYAALLYWMNVLVDGAYRLLDPRVEVN